jgi:hypothetical protein
VIHLTIDIITNDPAVEQRLIDFSDGEIGVTFTRDDFAPNFHIVDVKTTGRGVTTAELLDITQEELDQWEQDDAEDDEDNFTPYTSQYIDDLAQVDIDGEEI